MSDAFAPLSDAARAVFDAVPSVILIVDEDVRIQDGNQAAAEFLTAEGQSFLRHRGGEALRCLHAAEASAGCGSGPRCADCVIRGSVRQAAFGGRVVRRRARLEVVRSRATIHIYALVTASPFAHQGRSLVLLVIEDISEIAEIQRMIPICSVCGEIRDEEATWTRLEVYFKKHWDVDFSHGLCPACLQAEMEKVDSLTSASV